MTTLRTDLGNTRESARRIRFEPTGAITETNVQEAIEQVSVQSQNVPSPTPIPVTGASYAVTATDRIIEVNFAGAVTLNLPAASTRGGLDLIIKDVSGAASTNNISIVPNAADTGDIDGLDPLTINSDFGTFKIRPGTLVWRIDP